MYRNEDKTMVQILSDSSTLYSKSQAMNIGLEITPLVVIIGKDNYREFETIDSDTLLCKIENGAIPTSSQPQLEKKWIYIINMVKIKTLLISPWRLV